MCIFKIIDIYIKTVSEMLYLFYHGGGCQINDNLIGSFCVQGKKNRCNSLICIRG